MLRHNPSDPEALAALGPEYIAQPTRPEPRGPLVGIEASEMNAVLSAIQEQSAPSALPSPIAGHEFEVTLDELEEEKLSIELENKQT